MLLFNDFSVGDDGFAIHDIICDDDDKNVELNGEDSTDIPATIIDIVLSRSGRAIKPRQVLNI